MNVVGPALPRSRFLIVTHPPGAGLSEPSHSGALGWTTSTRARDPNLKQYSQEFLKLRRPLYQNETRTLSEPVTVSSPLFEVLPLLE